MSETTKQQDPAGQVRRFMAEEVCRVFDLPEWQARLLMDLYPGMQPPGVSVEAGEVYRFSARSCEAEFHRRLHALAWGYELDDGFDYSVSEDAHRVAVLADEEIANWNEFIAGIQKKNRNEAT